MDVTLLKILLSLSGTVILLLITVIVYFLKIIHSDTKIASEEIGKNKGRIELVELQLISDVKRIEQTTQLELRNLAQTVSKLSNSVEQLVQIQINNSH